MDAKFEYKSLTAREVGDVIAKHFEEQGYEVGEILTQIQYGMMIGVKVELSPKE